MKLLFDPDIQDYLDEDYHPTVGNIDLEKLASLPHREKLWQKHGYLWDLRRNYRNPAKMKEARRIIQGSVGKSLSDIQNRIKPLIKHIKPFREFLYWYVEDNHEIQWNSHKYGNYFYIEDNILVHEPKYGTWKTKKHNFTPKEASEYKKQKRRKEKLYKRQQKWIGLHEVSMINNPGLHNYYITLAAKINAIKGYYSEYLRYKGQYEGLNLNVRGKFNFDRYFMYDSIKKWKKESILLPILQESLRKLESGDFSPYYRSTNYLHSIGKECPHFEQP